MGQGPPPRLLALVSDRADAARRDEVERGQRPRPEYLLLEDRHGVELLDWSRLGGAAAAGRHPLLVARHVGRALARLGDCDAVLSDGEHVGIPLAVAQRALALAKPHVVIAHHLTAPKKRAFFRLLRAHRGMSRLIVHSRQQMAFAERYLGIPSGMLAFIPYAVDAQFWRPSEGPASDLIVSAGREQRDYATLAAACEGVPCELMVAAGSVHSPRAAWRVPQRWPANARSCQVSQAELRGWYARAALVVVPLIENDFQAGVTTILEAMAMGKPVIVSRTSGQGDVIRDGENGVLVPPGDPAALRRTIARLLASPTERRRLGRAARRDVEAAHTVEAYARGLADMLESCVASRGRVSSPGMR